MPKTISYCGAPPTPDAIWLRWNLDPVLLAALAAALVGYLVASRSWTAPDARRRRLAFTAGWAVAAVAFTSPICALSVSLFSARIAQHMVLLLVAAPLLALGDPAIGSWRRWARASRKTPLAAAGVFAVALWYWHAPEPYALTFESATIYWLMHLTLLAAAVWLWDAMLADRAAPAASAAAVTMAQMSALGALITFAPDAVYAPHALTTAAWNLSPLADQQLGGVIMWAPGGLLFMGVAALFAWAGVRQAMPARKPSPWGLPS